MAFLLALGFTFGCSPPVPGADHGRLLLDHPMLFRYVALPSNCEADV